MDERTLKKVARLARLRLRPEERSKQVAGLSRILEHFDSLARIRQDSQTSSEIAPTNLRDDRPSDSAARQRILENAPEQSRVEDGICFVVPRVIE